MPHAAPTKLSSICLIRHPLYLAFIQPQSTGAQCYGGYPIRILLKRGPNQSTPPQYAPKIPPKAYRAIDLIMVC
jgi:hypothetical protein